MTESDRSWLIRPATRADIPAITALEQSSGTAAHWKPEQYASLFRESSRRTVLVAEDKSSKCVQGFLVARNVAREWELENIVVSDESQRRGIGTRLLGELLDRAKNLGCESIFLEVRESNQAARAFYDKLHFEQSGRRRNYYRGPDEDAILYRLQLT
jgi:ribosomal-protein-alanine N-acetyltransferase